MSSSRVERWGRFHAAANLLVCAGLLTWPSSRAFPLALVLLGLVYFSTLLIISRERDRFAPANLVTVLRLAVLTGTCAHGVWYGFTWLNVAWLVAAEGGDWLDGRLARRYGATDLGGRLDQEVDALFVLWLSAAIWLATPMGSWVVLAGALRYLYVLATPLLPVVVFPAWFSLQSKTICVAAVLLLLVSLAPGVPAGLAVVASLTAVGGLCYSFGLTVVLQIRRP